MRQVSFGDIFQVIPMDVREVDEHWEDDHCVQIRVAPHFLGLLSPEFEKDKDVHGDL